MIFYLDFLDLLGEPSRSNALKCIEMSNSTENGSTYDFN